MLNDSFAFYVQKYFLSYLIAQREYGENTITSYRDTFRLFLCFIEISGQKTAKLKITDINRETIHSFLIWLDSERNNAAATRNVRLAHFKSFYGYVMIISPELSYLCSEIINIPFSRVAKKPPSYMTELETKHFLAAPDSNTKEGLRHMTILALLYDSGCRVQELIELNVSDITLGKCCRMYVHGKGNKYREIPIFGETGKILGKYISTFRLGNQDMLFKNRYGNRLTRQGISHVMMKYKNIVEMQYPEKIGVHVSPHLMRHSKATHLVNSGVDIFSVRDFLGHESVTTTQIYLTSNPEVTRKAIEQVARKTVPESTNFYTNEEKADLMAFLEQLI